MKAKSFKKTNPLDLYDKIDKNEISPVYIFFGNQIFLMEKAVELLKKQILKTSAEFNYSLFYGDSNEATEIIDNAKTYPMFSEKRLIVVKNAEKFPANELKILYKYLSSPLSSTCLVLLFMDNKKIQFQYNTDIVLVEFTADIKGTTLAIHKIAKNLGHPITKEAALTLISLVGENLQEINNEIEKLVIYIGDKKNIEVSDVEKLTEKIHTEDIFQFLNSVAKKDKAKTLESLLELELSDEDPLTILNLLSWRFRLIWKAKELMDKKLPKNQILKELKISSGALYHVQMQAKIFSYLDIKRIVKVLYESDLSLKTSYIPKNQILTKLALDMCS